jgi:diaminopimelate decarboxylase
MFDHDTITTFRSIPTPFYYYDMDLLRENLKLLKTASEKYGVKIHYALKANTNDPILEAVRAFGFGADCVSGNEVKKALNAGFPASSVYYAGVGKTDEEIIFSLKNNIGCLNVESMHELQVINTLARRMHIKAPVALRINPDVDGHTKPGITTGTRLDKFGIDKEEIPEIIRLLQDLQNVEFKGLHFHIGSQITEMQVFEQLAREVNKIQRAFISAGFFPEILDLGGGLGIDYNDPDKNPFPDYESYFSVYTENLELHEGQQLHFEPGRAVVAQCGNLITSVLYLKNSGENRFIIVDAGMNNLIRPALYGAEHKVQNLTGMGIGKKYQVAGPICESSDIFARNVTLSEVQRGDLLVIRSAGAYGEVMASGYNLREAAGAVYSDDFKETAIQTNVRQLS